MRRLSDDSICAQTSSALQEDVFNDSMLETDMVVLDVLNWTHAECGEPWSEAALCHNQEVKNAKRVAKESLWALACKVIANMSPTLSEEVAKMQKGPRSTNTSQPHLQLLAYDDGSLVGTTLNGVSLGADASQALPIRRGDVLRFGTGIEVRMERVSSVLRLDDPEGLSDFYKGIGDRRMSQALTQIASCPGTMEQERKTGFGTVSALVSQSCHTYTSHGDDNFDAALQPVPQRLPCVMRVEMMRRQEAAPPVSPPEQGQAAPQEFPPDATVSGFSERDDAAPQQIPARQEAARPVSPPERDQAAQQGLPPVRAVVSFSGQERAAPHRSPARQSAEPSDADQLVSPPQGVEPDRPANRVVSVSRVSFDADQPGLSPPQGVEPDRPANGSLPLSRVSSLPNGIPVRSGVSMIMSEVRLGHEQLVPPGISAGRAPHQLVSQTAPRRIPVVAVAAAPPQLPQPQPVGPLTYGMNRCPTWRVSPVPANRIAHA